MMLLSIQRLEKTPNATIGKLFINGVFACWTLEDVIREQPGVPVSLWKVKGSTAIPAGEYRVTLEPSARFGPDTLTINDVPGFSYIRMHAGNTSADTEGCPLLGMMVQNGQIVGGTSKPAVALVKSRVMGAMMDGEEVHIEVLNPLDVA